MYRLTIRIAQVEVLLKDAAGKTTGPVASGQNGAPGNHDDVPVPVPVVNRPQEHVSGPATADFHTSLDIPFDSSTEHPMNWDLTTEIPSPNINDDDPPGIGGPGLPGWGPTCTLTGDGYESRPGHAGKTSYELLGLGMFESLPPFEMIEDL